MQRSFIRSAAVRAAAVAALAAVAGACTPTQAHHGFVTDSVDAVVVQPGVDTRQTVQSRLGSPSTVSTLDGEAWYYVSQTQERFAFYTPDTVSRWILAVRFDENGVVASSERFGLERGQVVAYNDNETPTRGRELGLVEQLFGNIGRGSPIPIEEQNQGRPGRNQ